LPNNTGVTIGQGAFDHCFALTRLLIPACVTNFGNYVFWDDTGVTNAFIAGAPNLAPMLFESCANLTRVFCLSNAPTLGNTVFTAATNATVYYLPGTTGWSTFNQDSGLAPAILWNPQAQTNNARFGIQNNTFGFNITGTAGIPIAIYASTNPASLDWVQLQSCNLTNGSIYFSDLQWAEYPARFYRIGTP
jgi:hypothetical protein